MTHSSGFSESEPAGSEPQETDQANVELQEVKVPREGTGTEHEFSEFVLHMFERKSMDKLTEKGGVAGYLSFLEVDPQVGLPSNRVEEQRRRYGENRLTKRDPVTFLPFLIEAFGDRIIQMLCVAAVISIIFGLTLPDPHSGEVKRDTGWIEGVAICISVSIVTLMGSINNYQKAKKFEEMDEKQHILRTVMVRRDGVDVVINGAELVVGDILRVESGIQFTVDSLYIDGRQLKCNESAMTGEPDSIIKDPEADPFFLSGTMLEDGAGSLLVVGVGMNSYVGVLKEALDVDAEETPMQEHLNVLADRIGYAGMALAIVLIVALVIKEIILITAQDKDPNVSAFLRFVIIAITIIVVAIPEGLPLAVTIALAFSMKAMMKDQCLVRILASCETMGAATAICSDKTGTLTMNQMTVVQGLIVDSEFVIDGYKLKTKPGVTVADRDDLRNTVGLQSAALDEFCFAISINSSAREEKIDGEVVWVGNKTEHGLLRFCNKVEHSYEESRRRYPEEQVNQFPFNSTKKQMRTVVLWDTPRPYSPSPSAGATMDPADTTGRVYVKGAPEILLDNCEHYYAADGKVHSLTVEKRQQIFDIIEGMASEGNRTIGVASAEVPRGTPLDETDQLPLTFLGVLGIQDPIRLEVPKAVGRSIGAGVTVRMVTGDNITTAKAIAEKCGIMSNPQWDLAMSGQELRDMDKNDPERLLELLPRLRVLARSSPNDKHALVRRLQEIGEVVAVTGDGTNDAPALKLADVGFAMVSGTDIAKDAADMVLLDDNFATVVTATMWGRCVNDSVRKFIQYQLSINLGGCVLTVVGALASETSKEPFSPVQLLWLNLIMDTMAALALATERPDFKSLTRPPVFKQAPLLSNRMLTFICSHATIQTTLILLILFLGHNWFETVEGGDRCNQDFALFENWTISNVSEASGTWSLVNQTKFVKTEDQEFCEKVCHDEGGTLRGRYCQQGTEHSTVIFNTFIFLQAFNIFNARKLFVEVNPLEGLLDRSRILCGVFFVIVGFQVFAVEGAGKFMGTTGLSWKLWLFCILMGFIEIPLGFIVRLIPVRDFIPSSVQEKWDKEAALKKRLGVHDEQKP